MTQRDRDRRPVTLSRDQRAILAAVRDGYDDPWEATARARTFGFRGDSARSSHVVWELIQMGELRIGRHWELELA